MVHILNITRSDSNITQCRARAIGNISLVDIKSVGYITVNGIQFLTDIRQRGTHTGSLIIFQNLITCKSKCSFKLNGKIFIDLFSIIKREVKTIVLHFSQVTINGSAGRTQVVRNRIALLEDITTDFAESIHRNIQGVEQLHIKTYI